MGLEFEMDRMDSDDCYFRSLAAELQPKRDMLAQALRDMGMVPVVPQGSYFMLVDTAPLGESHNCHVAVKVESTPVIIWCFVLCQPSLQCPSSLWSFLCASRHTSFTVLFICDWFNFFFFFFFFFCF